eukprot:Sspe_Gene.31275::Locus_15443_Transcript_1_1_Confidence_1.000_Length_1496::g.31275::m.31275
MKIWVKRVTDDDNDALKVALDDDADVSDLIQEVVKLFAFGTNNDTLKASQLTILASDGTPLSNRHALAGVRETLLVKPKESVPVDISISQPPRGSSSTPRRQGVQGTMPSSSRLSVTPRTRPRGTLSSAPPGRRGPSPTVQSRDADSEHSQTTTKGTARAKDLGRGAPTPQPALTPRSRAPRGHSASLSSSRTTIHRRPLTPSTAVRAEAAKHKVPPSDDTPATPEPPEPPTPNPPSISTLSSAPATPFTSATPYTPLSLREQPCSPEPKSSTRRPPMSPNSDVAPPAQAAVLKRLTDIWESLEASELTPKADDERASKASPKLSTPNRGRTGNETPSKGKACTEFKPAWGNASQCVTCRQTKASHGRKQTDGKLLRSCSPPPRPSPNVPRPTTDAVRVGFSPSPHDITSAALGLVSAVPYSPGRADQE